MHIWGIIVYISCYLKKKRKEKKQKQKQKEGLARLLKQFWAAYCQLIKTSYQVDPTHLAPGFKLSD